MSLTIIGFEARDRKRGVKAGLCEDCAEDLNTDNLEEVERGMFRDVYCVNCYTKLGGSSKKKPDNTNERLCILLDHILEDIYPMLGLAPGEEADKEDLAPGVTQSKHPKDATEQVIIETRRDQEKEKVLEVLSKLSERGNTRFNENKLGQENTRIVVVCN